MSQESVIVEKSTGLEDVVRSLRALVRSTQNLGAASIEVLEREMRMAVEISEQLRDRIISNEELERARKDTLASEARQSAHRVVDLVSDVSTVGILNVIDFVNKFVDQRRPPLERVVRVGEKT